MKEYGLYNVKDYELCEYYGTLKEIAVYINESVSSLRSYLTRKRKGEQRLLKNTYKLVEVQENEIEEDAKTDKELFREIIRIFTDTEEAKTLKDKISEFEIFDEFKWILKGKLNQVMEYEEEWKQIPGFNYSISNYGHVRNDKNGKNKRLRYHRWIIQVDIYKDGKRFTIDVPRIEASLFIRKLDRTERVSYIDGDMRNNFYKNLEIVSK